MNRVPKTYQQKAIDKLVARSRELFAERGERIITFQSPTGSGKTFMVARYIKTLIEEFPQENFVFLWGSIGSGNLHKQSLKALQAEFAGFPPAVLLEDEFFGSRDEIRRNEVVVFNWEKLRQKNALGEWKNKVMRDKEGANFREVLKNTKDSEKKIILIIDESQAGAQGERALELRTDIIDPFLTVEMSATPHLKGQLVSVDPLDVIDEGMIKKQVIINADIDKIALDAKSSQEQILGAAITCREGLKRFYAANGVAINPLVLVQIPDKDEGEIKKRAVEEFLGAHDITYENGKLAVWLSEEKINQEEDTIKKFDSTVEFLIFKYAINTGWDCPRAQILVKFREAGKDAFEIQTLGRILRMPEAKHYSEERLNTAYVFSNLESITVKEEQYNPNIIKSLVAHRRDEYGDLTLPSYYKFRIDYGDITKTFRPFLEQSINTALGITKADAAHVLKQMKADGIKIGDPKESLMINEILDTAELDALIQTDIEITNDSIEMIIADNDKVSILNRLIKRNLNGFAAARSIPDVRTALYLWFEKYAGFILRDGGMERAIDTILMNRHFFEEVIASAVNSYKPEREKEVEQKSDKESVWNEQWQIPEVQNYNPNTHEKQSYKQYVLMPCYLQKDASQIEREFEKILSSSDEVQWWWKNGDEHMATNFGIKYIDQEGKTHTFQPDFLIQFKNGTCGIFDTKDGDDRIEDTRAKASALHEYVSKQKQKVLGGIVVKEGSQLYFNSDKEYKPFEWAAEVKDAGKRSSSWRFVSDIF